ncbi:ion channel [Halioxenophilus aromaticivorans]|uniref:Potassium channel family protein n=1 Tax=Halioxenophilus aromaticivorans TaxID=1306992 RepID=A0AAV3U3S6_9ALTE
MNLFTQIAVGTVVIIVTLILQVVFIGIAISALKRFGEPLSNPPYLYKSILAILLIVLWLIAGLSCSAWAWAGVFVMLGVFDGLEPALYFSVVTFTTLGYGDITLDPSWRLLASFAAVDGLIIFGLNSAFLVEFIARLRSAQDDHG